MQIAIDKVQRIEHFIVNPPKDGVELDEAMKLHMSLSMTLRYVLIFGGLNPADVQMEMILSDKLWEVIEKGLLELSGEDEDDDILLNRQMPPIKTFFIPGNFTVH